MSTLTEWVNEFNTLTIEIGRLIIERAQGYYDSRSLWHQAVQEYAQKRDELDQTILRLGESVKDLSKAEAAFTAPSPDSPGWLSDEAWAVLAPLPEESASCEEEVVAPMRKLAEGDPRLLRTLRLSALGDVVASLQWRRDMGKVELEIKSRELNDSRRRFEQEDESHTACNWNCSVKRAAPFYEKRRMHETKVDAQLSVLHSLERRLQQARSTVAALEIKEGLHKGTPMVLTRTRSRQLDEMSLQSFEIKGGEPAQDEFRDEFMSCCGSDVGEDRSP